MKNQNEVVTQNQNEVANHETQIVAFNAALTHEKVETVILCDVSGSMSGALPSGKSRIQVMKECLLRVVSSLNGQAAVILFGKTTTYLKSWESFDADRWAAGCTTNLAAAMRAANRLNPSHIIVITDGSPNQPAEAKAQARTMLCKVDVYYCGPGDGETVNFCKDFVQFGGQAIIDPQCLTMLETVKLFLCDSIATEGGAQ
jgi:von Willebrand factor type A domain